MILSFPVRPTIPPFIKELIRTVILLHVAHIKLRCPLGVTTERDFLGSRSGSNNLCAGSFIVFPQVSFRQICGGLVDHTSPGTFPGPVTEGNRFGKVATYCDLHDVGNLCTRLNAPYDLSRTWSGCIPAGRVKLIHHIVAGCHDRHLFYLGPRAERAGEL